MAKVLYYKMDIFENFAARLIRQKKDFEISQTSHTRKIKDGKYAMIFNQEGKSDFRILSLINKVRSSAKKLIGTTHDEKTHNIRFFDLFEIPNDEQKIFKIDIKGAYWNWALMTGVINEEHNLILEGIYEELLKEYRPLWGWTNAEKVALKELKKIRLKALGSLATKKTIDTYVKGEMTQRELKIEDTRNIYMSICKGIDDIMKMCSNSIDGCMYYYWDCMFVKAGKQDKAIEFFKDLKFDITVEKTTLRYSKIHSDLGHLVTDDGKRYKLRKEDAIMINQDYVSTEIEKHELNLITPKQDIQIAQDITAENTTPWYLRD